MFHRSNHGARMESQRRGTWDGHFENETDGAPVLVLGPQEGFCDVPASSSFSGHGAQEVVLSDLRGPRMTHVDTVVF